MVGAQRLLGCVLALQQPPEIGHHQCDKRYAKAHPLPRGQRAKRTVFSLLRRFIRDKEASILRAHEAMLIRRSG
jgi:hypothetical protein